MFTNCAQGFVVSSLCFFFGASAVFGIDAYEGEGKAHVLDDGRILNKYSNASKDPTAIVIDGGEQHFLIGDGTTNRILAPGKPIPSGTKTKMSLDGDGSKSAGEFSGTVTLAILSSGEWSLQVQDDEKLLLEYHFIDAGELVGGGGCEVGEGCGGGCRCSGCAACWCFCGLFNDPHCICLFPYPNLVVSG